MLYLLLPRQVREALRSLGVDDDTLKAAVSVPPSPEYGDLSVSLFVLKKRTQLDFNKLVEVIEAACEQCEHVEHVNGFVNLTLPFGWWWQRLFDPLTLAPKNVVIEYPSVNPNKPLHAGHLRNALIGESLKRMALWLGQDVSSINYINDLGLQIAETFYYLQQHYNTLNVEDVCDEKVDQCVGKLYVKASEYAQAHEEGVRRFLKDMEEGRVNVKDQCAKVVAAQMKTLEVFGVHSTPVYESDVLKMWDKGLQLLKDKGLLYYVGEGELKGCWVVKVKGEEKVVVRSDGVGTYFGRDIIFQLWKAGWLDSEVLPSPRADVILNVIGVEQQQPQRLIADVLKVLGVQCSYEHVSYEHVRLPHARFSGRKGTWLGYSVDEILALLSEKVKAHSEEDKVKVVVGAVAFAFLRQSPNKQIVFDWNKTLSVEAGNGAYVQYAYVRALRMVEGEEVEEVVVEDRDSKFLLMKMVMARYSVVEAWLKRDPSVLVRGVEQLAREFHTFYVSTPVLKASGAVRAFRIYLLKQFVKQLWELGKLVLVPMPSRM
jgi:arginyl-tRNA synthetase